ncbi:MAG: hypothetical protein ACR2HX_10670 [Pyrinomonadaceae bacterium]
MSSNSKSIYEDYIKPLSREEQLLLLDILQTELNNGDDNGQYHSILELHGLGKDIWQGVDPNEYVRRLREEWDDPAE